MAEFFISYSTLDATIVTPIVASLESAGHSCWIAPRDIPVGEPYARAIMHGLSSSNKVIVVITDNSAGSSDVLNEIDNAHRLRKQIFPVCFGRVNVPSELSYYLSRKQWVRLDAERPDEILVKLGLGQADGQDETISIEGKNSKPDAPGKFRKIWSNCWFYFGRVLLGLSGIMAIMAGFSIGNASQCANFTGWLFYLSGAALFASLIDPSLFGLKKRTHALLIYGVAVLLYLFAFGMYVSGDTDKSALEKANEAPAYLQD